MCASEAYNHASAKRATSVDFVSESITLCQSCGKPLGVDLCEAVFRADVRVALEDACAVLIDIPTDVDSQHLAVECIHEGDDALLVLSLAAVEMEI